MSSGGGAPHEAHEVRSQRLVASGSAVAGARTFVTETLRDWQVAPDAVDDAELVVSELVTNAFLHGHAEDVGITLADTGPAVRLEVVHQEPRIADDLALAPQTVDPREVHGRGLAIVDVLAGRWGVEHVAGVRRVWAELTARAGVVGAEQREPVLAQLHAALAVAGTPRAVGDAVTEWAHARLATAFVGVALPDGDPAFLRYLSVEPLPPESAAAWSRFPVTTDAPVAAAFREDRAFFHESRNAAVATFPDLGPALAAAEMAALVHLPLASAGQGPVGTLALAWEHGRVLDGDDRRWLTTVAAVTAAALLRVGVDTHDAARVEG